MILIPKITCPNCSESFSVTKLNGTCPECQKVLRSNKNTIFSSCIFLWFFLISPVIVSAFSQYGMLRTILFDVGLFLLLINGSFKFFLKIKTTE